MKVLIILHVLILSWQLAGAQAQSYPLKNITGLSGYGITLSASEFKRKSAVRIIPAADNQDGGREMIAIVEGSNFHNGIIEVELASQPGDNAPEGSRGFAGIAFRMQDENHFECIYIRPTNGRADDQLRRNHSTQYISHPDYPWYRLRKENPGVYESYVDLQPGIWTKIKIEVEGLSAKLYVNNSDQPVLLINDLKYGPDQVGPIGLWIGSGTDAYFSNLKVVRK